jgi:hypothetical protein
MRALFLAGLMACGGGEIEEPTPVRALLDVQEPLPGAFVAAGDVAVKGAVAGVTTVTVNGVDASLSGGSFEGTVPLEPGLNLVEVVATQDDGDTMFVRHGVHAGPTAPPKNGAPYPGAAVARVNQSGLDLIMNIAEDIADSIDPAALLGGSGGPLVEVPVDVLGIGLGTLVGDLQDDPDALSFSGIEMTADPQANGFLRLDATVDNVHVALDVTIDFPLGDLFDIDGYVVIDTGVQAAIIMGFDVVDGALQLDAGLDAPSFTFTNFTLDTNLWDIIDSLADGFLEDLLRDTLVEQVDALLPTVLDGLLDELPLTFDLPLGEQPITLEAVLTEGGIDEDGMYIYTDLGIDTGASCPAGVGHLVAPAAEPVVPRTPDLGVAISDDLVNGLLLDLWCTGLLELELSSDDPDLGTLVTLLLEPLQVTEGTVTVSAGLPPVLIERGGGLVLQVSELLMTIDTPGRVLGETVTVMLHVDADLTVSIVENAPRIVIGEARITTVSRASDWGASNEATTALMDQALGPILDSVPALLNLTLATQFGQALELDLLGLSIAEALVGHEPGASHLSMDVTLGYDPDDFTFTGF